MTSVYQWPPGTLKNPPDNPGPSCAVPRIYFDLEQHGQQSRTDSRQSQGRDCTNVTDQWFDLKCPRAELSLELVLPPGQSFGWKRLSVDRWIGVVRDSAIVLKQASTTVFAQIVAGPATESDVRTYFGLDLGVPPLAELYCTWSESCPRLAKVAACLPGLRVLQQDPVETLFVFICSSNNNVSRIALLLDRMKAQLGTKICDLPSGESAIDDDGPSNDGGLRDLSHVREFNARGSLHCFPSIEVLAGMPEASLRSMGLGYRAAYVCGAAKGLLERGGVAFLESLRDGRSRTEVQGALCELLGIGPKVADCIALFALKQHACIPVDVHVWRITTRDYEPALKALSLTPKVYERVGEAFRCRFGRYAGWAHSLLFGAELAGATRARLPPELLEEMDLYRKEQKESAVRLRQAKARAKVNGKPPPRDSGRVQKQPARRGIVAKRGNVAKRPAKRCPGVS